MSSTSCWPVGIRPPPKEHQCGGGERARLGCSDRLELLIQEGGSVCRQRAMV
jgi:hypothetical protein